MAILFLLQGCHSSEAYNQKIKSLDSLGGVIGSMVKELEKADTITLQKAVNRYNYYNAFMQQNLNDTVSKSDADYLQHFYTSGKTLQNYSFNNKIIVERASRVLKQLAKLSEDAKSKTVDLPTLITYYDIEKTEAEKLMQTANTHQKQVLLSLEEFKTSLPGVEQLIKSRNNGELPTIIKDTVNL
jgi:hypothetical protein